MSVQKDTFKIRLYECLGSEYSCHKVDKSADHVDMAVCIEPASSINYIYVYSKRTHVNYIKIDTLT